MSCVTVAAILDSMKYSSKHSINNGLNKMPIKTYLTKD